MLVHSEATYRDEGEDHREGDVFPLPEYLFD